MSTRLTGALLILCGVLAALSRLEVPVRLWMGPAVLVGFGLLALCFPTEWAALRSRRDDRKDDHR